MDSANSAEHCDQAPSAALANREGLLADLRGQAQHHFDWAALSTYNPDARDNARYGTAQDWERELDNARKTVARTVGFDAGAIEFFPNATECARRAVLRLAAHLKQRTATLLTSDLEFPGIIAMLDEHWPGPMYLAKVQDFIVQGRHAEVEDQLKREMLLTQPDVVYLSHVARASGFAVSTELLRWIQAWRRKTLVILDGSQAAGNIALDDDILRLRLAPFYFFSGHKWLLGKPTIGVLVAEERFALADPAQSYSRRHGSAGSGDIEALIGLTRMLDCLTSQKTLCETTEHTAKLSEQFVAQLKSAEIALPADADGWRANGIVAIPVAEAQAEALNRSAEFEFTPNQLVWPQKPRMSLLGPEKWRGREGWVSSIERYVVRCGKQPEVVDVRLREELWGWSNGIRILRVSLHGAIHDDRAVQQLADKLKSVLSQKRAE